MANNKAETKPPPETAFQGKQLTLFQAFLCNSDEERDRLSNTVELWDGVPKYFISRQKMNGMRSAESVLKPLERKFEYREHRYTVQIIPARVSDGKGNFKDFYPSAREEIIEDALRKIAGDQYHGFLDSESSGVVFSLNILRQELEKRGHGYKYEELIESLTIMSRCRIVIHREGEKRGIDVPILTELVGVNRDEYRADPKMRWFVRFNSLVTESIKAITYRQYNYHTMMSHRSQLARWLHKRLAHNYRQAHLLHPYQMALSSLRRDSCLVPDGREGVRRVEAALKELENNGVLLCYKRESRRGERNKLIDSVFTVTPTTSFVRDVKAANKRQSDTMIFGS